MDFQENKYDENFAENWRRDSQLDSKEANSRREYPLLWDLYDQVEQEAKKAGIAVNWVSLDYLDRVVIGNYEVSQAVFGSHDFKCLRVQPHSSEDMSRFAMFIESPDEVSAFFEGHFNALQELRTTI